MMVDSVECAGPQKHSGESLVLIQLCSVCTKDCWILVIFQVHVWDIWPSEETILFSMGCRLCQNWHKCLHL